MDSHLFTQTSIMNELELKINMFAAPTYSCCFVLDESNGSSIVAMLLLS
jgi:hypothetical protein